MIITCPICRIKFNLDDERIPEGRAKVRCSKCQHVFQVQKSSPLERTSPPDKIPPSAIPENLYPKTPRKIEMPPRKKPAASRFSSPRVIIIVILILIGIGYGASLVWKNPEVSREIGSRFSILKQSLGLSDKTEGFLALEKVKGYYLENKRLTRIFVIEGQAVNHWQEARSFIKVKGTLLDAKGEKVEEKTGYCGNILLEEDLKAFSREEIAKSLSSQFGETFSNVNISPGKSVPFMIVFTDFSSGRMPGRPEQQPAAKAGEGSPGISDFLVEVVSSQKGSRDQSWPPSAPK
jgi:predicted Zn finger-like uncharacterized protein